MTLDNPGAVVQTTDSGFMAVSSHSPSFENGFFNLKVDKNGDTLWIKKFLGYQGWISIGNYGGARLSDSTYFFAGALVVGGRYSAYLFHFDQNGDTLKVM